MASASPILQAMAHLPTHPVVITRSVKRLQPLLHGQRPRFKEAKFNGTKTATVCFLLYPVEFISTFLCSTPQTSPCALLISIRTMCCKENCKTVNNDCQGNRNNSSAWFQGETPQFRLCLSSPLLVPEL